MHRHLREGLDGASRYLQARAPRRVLEFGRAITQVPVSRRMRPMYGQFVKPGDLVFDIGAHTGGRTAVFLAIGAKVVAVEPQESCVKTLRRRYARDQRVEIVPSAVAEAEGEAELFVCSRATTVTTMSAAWMKGRFAEYEWDQVQPIHTTTMDALVSRYGVPTFCKIDVEGLEYEVLRGLSSPIPALSIEFVSERLDATGRCLDRLEEIGFHRFSYSLAESGRLEVPPDTPISRQALDAILSGFADPLTWGDVYALA
jgi:FkbM family methyltransferase